MRNPRMAGSPSSLSIAASWSASASRWAWSTWQQVLALSRPNCRHRHFLFHCLQDCRCVHRQRPIQTQATFFVVEVVEVLLGVHLFFVQPRKDPFRVARARMLRNEASRCPQGLSADRCIGLLGGSGHCVFPDFDPETTSLTPIMKASRMGLDCGWKRIALARSTSAFCKLLSAAAAACARTPA